MNQKLVIPDETRVKQALAADPANSAWVSANAGSGKTHVLSRRVIRLLLEGTDPSRILCLTYTKAAAANMATKVFEVLARWSTLPDTGLDEELGEIDGRRPNAERRREARRLFARALETPGGLKIQTIHAFCEAVLHQFPLEANVAGHFELLDSQMEAALMAEARRDLLSGMADGGDLELGEAFATVLAIAGETGLEQLMGEIVGRRDLLAAFIGQIGREPEPYGELYEEFSFPPGRTVAAVAATVWPLPGLSRERFAALTAAAQETDARALLGSLVPNVAEAFGQPDPVAALGLLKKGLLTDKGQPYAVKSFKSALRERLPGIYESYLDAAGHVREIADRVNLLRMIEATVAALRLADRLIGRYERLKSGRGFLDFNDLITRTARLLSREDAGAWVQYKLDRGIDHILIDEAQDTSPEQWAVIRKLAAEFFTGMGARDNIRRTIFAVGDEKQSIYSFQGAEPASFADSGRDFAGQARQTGKFERVELRHSFRSTDDVLRAVDLVFADEGRRKGLTTYDEPIAHAAIRAGAPGYVELWPSIAADTAEEPEDWTRPVDHASAPAVLLAERIADRITGWIRAGEINEATGKAVRPGDIIVLVRKRDRFVHALVRALKHPARAIPVAGADRLRLAAHIAVRDLVALGRFALQQEDDLSLAAVLKSPIFGLDDDALYAIAHGRPAGTSLWSALAAEEGPHEAVAAQLRGFRDMAGYGSVFDFYGRVLAGDPARPGARARLIGRLGHEAGDIIDEFLGYCLASERTGRSGLEEFLAGFENSAPEIKREMDQTRDEVRIMTVHAAKGLEAPIVFLVDGGSAAFREQHQPRLLRFLPKREGWSGPGFLWRAASPLANEVSTAIGRQTRDKAEDEYRRLLYVGMTRAGDRLVVCGYHGSRGQPDPSWHGMVAAALTASPDCKAIQGPDGEVLRFAVTPPRRIDSPGGNVEAAAAHPLPSFLDRAPPPAPPMPRPLAPSGASAVIEAGGQPVVSLLSPVLDRTDWPAFAAERGSAIHRLLQVLPEVAEEMRPPTARLYLERAGAAWPPGEIDAAWRSVAAVLEDRRFAPVFAAGSRAEVSVMGTVALGRRAYAISGTVDRLAVAPDSVLIVDYKTNRPPASGIGDVPEAYRAQLALYRELLRPVYPGRSIRAALLFTEAPLLLEIGETVLDAALARLTRP